MRKPFGLVVAFLTPYVLVTGILLAQEPALPPTKKATADEIKRLAGASKLDGIVGGLSGNTISVLVPDDTQYRIAVKRMSLMKGAQLEEAKKQIMTIPRGKEYEIELSEKCSLRKANMSNAPEFDDKGNLKVYTAAEKAKMKGTGPGWTAVPEDIASGLPVSVTLTRDKKDSHKPVATMIYVNNTPKKTP